MKYGGQWLKARGFKEVKSEGQWSRGFVIDRGGFWRKEVIGMAIDPVCKMEVDEKKAAATYEYKGKKYYFCAAGCKDRFSKEPEKFLGKEKT